LIPDNVQEQPYRLAERLSPTNFGFLLNARQAAVEFGFLTVSEFVRLTENSLNSALLLPRHMGHFLNWYDNISRKPIGEPFVSSVDSGNLIASLWSLKQGCLELMREPVLPRATLHGLEDHLLLAGCSPRGQIQKAVCSPSIDEGLSRLFMVQESLSNMSGPDANWTEELHVRYRAIEQEVRDFAPWLLPEYEPLRKLGKAKLELPSSSPVPQKAAVIYARLEGKLKDLVAQSDSPVAVVDLSLKLQKELANSRDKLEQLNFRLKAIASLCDQLGREMAFKPLVDQGRRLLSIGYDVKKGELNKSCYDLLASESRTATFIAVAKGETLQESWFRLGRQHTLCEGENVLISWTGTMFEYLMPVIWEKSHPETLLDRSVRAAVRTQQSYAKARHIPWGISEAAYSKTDEEGNYQYSAFGVPGLALSVSRESSLVVSPYSSCLALLVDPAKSVENLLRMAKRKWLSEYGFFESIDYSLSANFLGRRKFEVIRCWMAHHQGMSLAAICNLLNEASFQRWFHAEPLVQASDLILQERPLRVRAISDKQPRRVLSLARSAFRVAGARSKASA
jgi:cyclic beta-1,2-glucan synthetase